MRKVLFLLFVLIVVFSFVSCDELENVIPEPAPEANSEIPPAESETKEKDESAPLASVDISANDNTEFFQIDDEPTDEPSSSSENQGEELYEDSNLKAEALEGYNFQEDVREEEVIDPLDEEISGMQEIRTEEPDDGGFDRIPRRP